jgi:glutathione S-transferase
MLKIWGRADSGNVQKVTWAAGELGLAFERVDVGGPFGKLEEPAYRKLNPNSKVPTIEDDGFVLWESNAIVRYLALKHGKGGLCPADLRVRADADRWMDWCTTTFLPQMVPVFVGLVKTPPEKRDMKVIEAARVQWETLVAMLNDALAGRNYVAGADFSMGDIPLGVFVHRWFSIPMQRADMPNVAAWYARLRQRPAFIEHVVKAAG